MAKITANDWALKNAVLSLTNINQASPQLSLLSATLTLPPPLESISALNIQCQHFLWDENFLDCSRGRIRFDTDQFNMPAVDFSFQFQNNKSFIEVNQLAMLGGFISVKAEEIAGKWQVLFKAQGIDLVNLYALIAIDGMAVMRGQVDIEMLIKGEQSTLQNFVISVLVKGLSVQDSQEHLGSEELVIKSELSAYRQDIGWQWHSTNILQKGKLYIEPVYLDVGVNNAVTLSAQGVWLAEQKTLQINQLQLEQPQVIKLQGSAILNHKAGIRIEQADLLVDIPQLKSASPVYILPFLESSVFSDIELAGKVNAELTVKHNSLTAASIIIKDLGLEDPDQQLYIHQANAHINWTKQQEDITASFINWKRLKVHAILFQAGQLDFSSFDNQVELLSQAKLAVLGGTLSVHNFSFSSLKKDAGASINFDGRIDDLSLEQLSKALNWTPLTGTISGYIPSVHYHDKTFSLDGELKMQVFDGEIRIKNLASSGVLTNFSQFYADIAFDRLDLAAMTQKFHTGYIEGRLSGTVQNLYLENWQAVSFYAWIGTPEDDDSTHRISQKAVENIASIGGGNISDVLSRGFLGLFSTFGYNKLGLGCYLYQGVCQLMGVEAVDNGFYLIKGGGIPSINVIGYNPRLDWNELLVRLNRIATSDEVIIE